MVRWSIGGGVIARLLAAGTGVRFLPLFRVMSRGGVLDLVLPRSEGDGKVGGDLAPLPGGVPDMFPHVALGPRPRAGGRWGQLADSSRQPAMQPSSHPPTVFACYVAGRGIG